MSLADNLCLTLFRPFTTAGWISRRQQNKGTAALMRRLDVRAREPEQLIGELSGGSAALTNAGARVGDVIVLTKPIGTGVILVRGMRSANASRI